MQDEPGGALPQGLYPMDFTAQGIALNAETKGTVDNDWQGVQTVAVQVGSEVKEYTVTPADDYLTAELTSTAPFYWQNTAPLTVSAWWPYAAEMPDVVVLPNQNTPENYQLSDYICALDQTVQFRGSTALAFEHRTAKVAVILKHGGGMTDGELAQATVSLTGVTTGNAADGNTVSTYHNGGSYLALLPPQTVPAGQDFIQITLATGVTYVYKTEEAARLEGGYQYAYEITVSKAGLKLADTSISGWTDNPGNHGEGSSILTHSFNQGTNTYTVYTADGLDAWAADVRDGNRGANCILANDIDYGGKTWGGTGDLPYTGTFDGGGYTLSNMVIPAGSTYSGLFYSLSGTVQNLVLDGVSLQASTSMNGLIAGSNRRTIAGCTILSSCKINVSDRSSHTGGIAGNNNGQITRCHAACSFEGTEGMSYGGGIAGLNGGSIIASSYAGSYNIDNRTATYAGSLVGGLQANSLVTACWSSVKLVSSATMYGMVASMSGGIITTCYWGGNGIAGNGTGTQVTGGNWQSAIDAMNAALGADFGWQYVKGEDGLPELVEKP